MKSLNQYFAEYEASHQVFGNKVCHLIGIPSIMVSLLALLSFVSIGQWLSLPDSVAVWMNGGTLLWFVASLLYIKLNWKLGIPFSILVFGIYLLSLRLSMTVTLILFIGGWVVQFVGHLVFEKKQPAFFSNLLHALIGPLWFFAKALRFR